MTAELLLGGGGIAALTTTALGRTMLATVSGVAQTAVEGASAPSAPSVVNASVVWATFAVIVEYNTPGGLAALVSAATSGGVVNTTRLLLLATPSDTWTAPVSTTVARRLAASAASLTKVVMSIIPPQAALAAVGVMGGETGAVASLFATSLAQWAAAPTPAFLASWSAGTGVANPIVLLGAVTANTIPQPTPPPVPPTPLPPGVVAAAVIGALVMTAGLCSGGLVFAAALRRAYREAHAVRVAHRAAHDAITGRPRHLKEAEVEGARVRHVLARIGGVFADAGERLAPQAVDIIFKKYLGGPRPRPPPPAANPALYADVDESAYVNPVLDKAEEDEAAVDDAAGVGLDVLAKGAAPHQSHPLGARLAALLGRHPVPAPVTDPLPPAPARHALKRADSAAFDLTAAPQAPAAAPDFDGHDTHDHTDLTDISSSSVRRITVDALSPTDAIAAVRRSFDARGLAVRLDARETRLAAALAMGTAAADDALAPQFSNARVRADADAAVRSGPVSPTRASGASVRFSAAAPSSRAVLSVDEPLSSPRGGGRGAPLSVDRVSEKGLQLRFATPIARQMGAGAVARLGVPVGVTPLTPTTPSFAPIGAPTSVGRRA